MNDLIITSALRVQIITKNMVFLDVGNIPLKQMKRQGPNLNIVLDFGLQSTRN
jgi:hypothetical protein